MSTVADKPVRHILALSGDKAASYVRALDMLDPILTRHYPRPIVGGSRGAFKDGDTSSKSQRKASDNRQSMRVLILCGDSLYGECC